MPVPFAASSLLRLLPLLFLFAVVSLGQTLRGQEGALASPPSAEENGGDSFALALAEKAWTRLSPSPAAPEGVVSSPEPTFDRKLALLGASLVEEARYRVESTIDSLAAAFARPLNPTDIIDGSWTKVADTTKQPYRAVCYVETTWPKKKNGGHIKTAGTAFFVGRRVLLTNAHVLYSSKFGGWALEVKVTPGRQGNKEPYGSQIATAMSIVGEYLGNEEDADYDMGWIILPDGSLYDRVRFNFGYAVTTNNFLQNAVLRSLGYPEADARNYQMYYDYSTHKQDVRTKHFLHYHDSLPGSSGGPMYYVEEGKRYVVGVAQGGTEGAKPSERYNVATRMIRTYFDFTKDFVRDNP